MERVAITLDLFYLDSDGLREVFSRELILLTELDETHSNLQSLPLSQIILKVQLPEYNEDSCDSEYVDHTGNDSDPLEQLLSFEVDASVKR
jgi:hypothetical protein